MNGEIILRRHIHGEHGIYIDIEWALLQLKTIYMIIYRIEHNLYSWIMMTCKSDTKKVFYLWI